MATTISAVKAKKILKDGTIRGRPITSKQKKFFGLIAGGGKSSKLKKRRKKKRRNK